MKKFIAIILAVVLPLFGIAYWMTTSSSETAQAEKEEKKVEKEKQAAKVAALAQTAPKPKEPTEKVLTFEKGPIVSFKYNGGPLIWEAIGGKIEFVDSLGNKWSDDPKMINHRGAVAHKGWHFVSKSPNSTATGVKITQIWE